MDRFTDRFLAVIGNLDHFGNSPSIIIADINCIVIIDTHPIVVVSIIVIADIAIVGCHLQRNCDIGLLNTIRNFN